MPGELKQLVRTALAIVMGSALAFSGCGGDKPSATSNAPVAGTAPTETASVKSVLEPTDQIWSPEALEELTAPIALYPDSILGQVFVAATNPQEILDAGNWRLKNESLQGSALDDAAKKVGFTPPVRMLIQNPVVLDMMGSELGWTTELGQAYVNDQSGLLEAVQRLRHQARDAGNLASSDKLVVESEAENGQDVVVISSPEPDVVYVPQYDPEVAYVSAEQYEAEDDDDGTARTVATAVLAFGAGLALSNVFNDDDDDWYDDDYYYPSYYGEPMPYYSHYPYRPVYGGDFYASNTYVRPPNYRYAYNSNTVVVRRGNDNYWDRYDDRTMTRRDATSYRSPITRANPNRSDLVALNERSQKGPKRRASKDAYGKGRDPNVTARKGDRNRKKDGDRRQDTGKADGDRRGGDVDRDRAGDRGGGGKADAGRRGGGGGDRGASKGGDRGGGKPKGGGGGGGGRKRGG